MVLFFAAITIFRWLSRILDGVAEVLVVFDQKRLKMTLGDMKTAYERGEQKIKQKLNLSLTRLKSNDKLFTTNKKDILKSRVISPLAFKES